MSEAVHEKNQESGVPCSFSRMLRFWTLLFFATVLLQSCRSDGTGSNPGLKFSADPAENGVLPITQTWGGRATIDADGDATHEQGDGPHPVVIRLVSWSAAPSEIESAVILSHMLYSVYCANMHMLDAAPTTVLRGELEMAARQKQSLEYSVQELQRVAGWDERYSHLADVLMGDDPESVRDAFSIPTNDEQWKQFVDSRNEARRMLDGYRSSQFLGFKFVTGDSAGVQVQLLQVVGILKGEEQSLPFSVIAPRRSSLHDDKYLYGATFSM